MSVTNADRRMISYFIMEKGDITRWVNWNSRKEIIEAEYPELVKALQDYAAAEKILHLVVKNIENDDDGTD